MSSKHKRAKRVIRLFVLLCLPPAVFLPAGSVAQQPVKVPRIGILGSSSISGAERSQAIRAALRELGYIAGENVVFEERYREGTPDGRRRDDFAAELVRLNVDVIVVAGGNNVVRAAMDATKTIPIVLMGQGTDPVAAASLRVLPARAAMSPGFQTFPHISVASDWSYSKRQFRNSPVSRFSTIRPHQALRVS